MDRFPAPIPRPLRLSVALLSTSVVVGCQDGTPVEPAHDDEFDLTIEGAQIDLSIFDRSALGDIGLLVGVETLQGGPLRGQGDPPTSAAPVAPGEPPIHTPLETTVIIYYVTIWLYENGHLDAPSAISALLPVIDAYSSLLVDDAPTAIDSFNEFILVVQGLVDDSLLDPVAGQWLIDCAQGAINQLVPTANADGPYDVDQNAILTVGAGTGPPDGLLVNDALGNPAATLTSYSGGSLGGAVTDHAAGASVFGLTVNGDGSFELVNPELVGTYTVQYRITNTAGTSDATVTINVNAVGGAPAATSDGSL